MRSHHQPVKEASQIPIQCILLVTAYSLVSGNSGNIIRGRKFSSRVGRDLAKSSWPRTLCKMRRHWALETQLKAASPDTWSYKGGLQIRLARERRSPQGRPLLSKTQGQDFILQLNKKSFLFSFILALAWEITPSSVPARPLIREITFQAAGFIIKRFQTVHEIC